MSTLLEVKEVGFAYRDRPVLHGVSFALHPHEVVGLVGPNGSGKSTLLRLLLGMFQVYRGDVILAGMPIRTLSRKELAKHAALVPQDTAIDVAFSVRDVVAMGRNPYLGRFRPETSADVEIIQWALATTETDRFADRPINTLSGGERQRVIMARALAQQPRIFLLDEPTANLDLVHQLEILALVRTVVQEGRCALIALHDLALAVRFCDRIILLSEGKIVAHGKPEEVITEEHLATYFSIHAKIRRDTETGAMLLLPLAPTRLSDPMTLHSPAPGRRGDQASPCGPIRSQGR